MLVVPWKLIPWKTNAMQSNITKDGKYGIFELWCLIITICIITTSACQGGRSL